MLCFGSVLLYKFTKGYHFITHYIEGGQMQSPTYFAISLIELGRTVVKQIQYLLKTNIISNFELKLLVMFTGMNVIDFSQGFPDKESC